MTDDRRSSAELSPVKQALAEIRRLKRQLADAQGGPVQPIALVGVGIRLPGAGANADDLGELLGDGIDAICDVPADRWDVDAFYHPDKGTPGMMYTREGGFLRDVRGFDPEFFGIAPLEADAIDPQHRLLLEVAWEALEHAGISPTGLRGSQAGVFLGMSAADYNRLALANPRHVDAYASAGTAMSVAAGRIAYLLDLRGPAVTIDTACSSSLVATCMAARSLASGESDLALVGGVNLILGPEVTINFCQAGMLAPDGRCKTFDDRADGYVRSEGCVVLVLKRLADARRSGDRVLALIRGGAVNQDGRSSGITAPNGPAQEAVIRAALANAGVTPEEIGYVEAHGTGTSLGDPIELQALGSVFGQRSDDEPLWVGSVKANFGHLEAAAGLLGLVKVVEALRRREIPPQLHFRTPNSHVPWAELPISVPTARTPFAPHHGRRLAGVSSFGFSGTNAHVILEEAPEPADSSPRRFAEPALHVLPLSADREEALRELAGRYVELLGTSADSLGDICYTAGVGRAHRSHRLAVAAAEKAAARDALQRWLADGGDERVVGEIRESTGADEPTPAFDDPLDDEAVAALLDASRNGGLQAAALTALARFYVAGAEIDWAAVHAGQRRRRVSLPTYPFQRRGFWLPERRPALPAGDASPPRSGARERSPFDAALAAATHRASLAPLDMNIDSYAEKWSVLRELTRILGHNLLVTRGAFAGDAPRDLDAVLTRCGIKPIYGRIVRRWLDAMVDDGAFERAGDGWRAAVEPEPIDDGPAWQQVERALQDNEPLLAYLRNCARHLEGVLTGSVSPLETLFPDGGFDLAVDLYEGATQLRYINGIAAAVLETWVRECRSSGAIRVLEVGAGTGGTTASLLPVLPAERTRYDYTDVSDVFLDFSRERFPDPRVLRAIRFDMEEEIEVQGFEPGSYDVVAASNVVHAARDLRASLRRLRSLLAPGGLLLMVESTGHLEWHDITTGLIEGWQHFEDELRSDTPLLDVDAWRSVLEEEGFAAVGASPPADSPAAILAQHVVFAVAPGEPVSRADAGGDPRRATAPAGDETVAAVEAADAVAGAFVARLEGAVASEREQIAADAVRGCVVDVLRADPSRPPALDARLMDLGLDSLMAVRLRNAIQEQLALPLSLPSTLMFDYPTVRHIARLILARLDGDAEVASDSSRGGDTESSSARQDRDTKQPEASGRGADDNDQRREAEIAELSDDEVEALLVDRLGAGESR